MKIGFTESGKLKNFLRERNDKPLSYALANAVIGYLDKYETDYGYDKTDFSISVLGGENDGVDYEGRYNIGTENGSLTDHIVSRLKYYINDSNNSD